MKMPVRTCYLAIFTAAIIVFAGCASLQPSRYDRPAEITALPWKSYEEVENAAKKLTVGETALEEQKELGFNPARIPNTRKITDVRRELLPNATSTIDELPREAQICYRKSTKCEGYRFFIRVTQQKGTGNLFLRLINVKKETTTTGWEAEVVIYLLPREELRALPPEDPRRNEMVFAFGQFGGTPNIQTVSTEKKPLGWFGSILDIGSRFSPCGAPNVNTEKDHLINFRRQLFTR